MHMHGAVRNDTYDTCDAYTTGHVHMLGAVRNDTYDTCDAYTTRRMHIHGAVRNDTYDTCDAYTTRHVHVHGAVRNDTYDTCDAYTTRRKRRIHDTKSLGVRHIQDTKSLGSALNNIQGSGTPGGPGRLSLRNLEVKLGQSEPPPPAFPGGRGGREGGGGVPAQVGPRPAGRQHLRRPLREVPLETVNPSRGLGQLRLWF